MPVVLPTEAMAVHPVGSAVGSVINDSPHGCAPLVSA
jgi:hypothetical protein